MDDIVIISSIVETEEIVSKIAGNEPLSVDFM